MKPHNLTGTVRLFGALLLAAIAVSTSRADYPSTVLGLNPIAYWQFNEAAGSPALNTVADSSAGGTSTGYVVTVPGVPPVDKGQTGIVGNCVRLHNPGDDAGTCGSKVDMPYNIQINPAAPLTIEFWAKPAIVAGDATGVCPLSAMSPYFFASARCGWLFYLAPTGKWTVRFGGENSYVAVVTEPTGSAAANVWQHLAATFDGTTVTLYINGVNRGSAIAGAGFKANGWVALRIGGTSLNGSLGYYSSGNRGWDGWVDEVAVYNTALSANTLAAHHDAAATNNAGYHAQILASNPVGYWELDEPAFTDPDPSTFPSAANSGSAGTDLIGTNTFGGVSGAPGVPFSGFPVGNKSVFFTGEYGNLMLGDLASTPELSFTGPITLMAWVKPTVVGGWRSIIAHGFDGAGAETYLRIGNTVDFEGTGNANTAYYEVGETADATTYHSAAFPVPAGDIGNWVFLVGTWDGSNWNLYRNGVLVASAPDDTGPINVTNRWSVGSRSEPANNDGPAGVSGPAFGMFFGGSIDEPAIFNTALSVGNISSLYAAASVPPIITTAPQAPSGTVYEGSTVSFTVVADGAPTLHYQWNKNSSPLGGQTTTALTLSAVTVASSGTYSVVVTNTFGSVTSSVPLVVLTSPPLITQQPGSATRWNGAQFIFSVGSIGSTPLSYQWNLGGSPISGATFQSYTNTASGGVAGNYTCTITNIYGSSNSAIASLTVLTVPAGYASAVMADHPVAYWRLGETSGTTANDYAGGVNGTYLGGVQLGQPGYSAIDPDLAAVFSGNNNTYVGNISGSAINFQGTGPSFTLEAWVNGPAAQTDQAGIVAKGTGSNGGTATEQFCLDITAGTYRFFTRGGGNTFYAATASAGPNGTWQHVVGTYDNAAHVLSIYVNGDLQGTAATRTAGLRASTAPVSIGARRSGVSPDYDLPFAGTIDEVAVYPTALSQSQVLAHYGAAYGPSLRPIISQQPAPTTNYVTLPAKMTVGAYGTIPLTYQWHKDGVDVPGATSSAYPIASLAPSDAGNYTVTITNPNGVTNSASAPLVVLAAPVTPPAIPGLVLHITCDGSLNDQTGRGNNGLSIHVVTNAAGGGFSSNAVAATYYPGNPVNPLGQSFHYSTDTSAEPGNLGIATNDFYMTLGHRTDLDFSSNVNFSVSLWIQFPANVFQGDLPYLCSAVGSYQNPGFTFAPSYNLGSWSYSLNGNVQLYGPDHAIDDGLFHNLVHTFDRNGLAVTYLDGHLVDSRSAVGIGDLDTGNFVNVGQDPTGFYPETGAYQVADLGVWRKVLTPLEAASIYMAATASQLSFTGAPIPPLTIQRVGNQVHLTWSVGTLQSADVVTGPYVNVTPVSPYNAPATAAKKFYRVKL